MSHPGYESTHRRYPPGAPCWVETLQPDPQAASSFYGQLFGWRFQPTCMPEGLEGQYFAARIGERLVAGIGQAPAPTPTALWITYISVESVDAALSRVSDAGGTLVAGPLSAGPDGRMAVVADSVGISYGLWEPGERAGVQLADEPGTWGMSALHTPDPGRAESFYGAVFGWKLRAVPGAPFAFWRLPGYVGGDPDQSIPRDVVAVMAPIEQPSEVPPHWAVNFRVDDVDSTAEHALALGGTLLLAPTDTPGFRSAVIADPQHGVIAISAPMSA